jgi:ABC-2 type transport system ATP-binding protein
MSIDIDRSAAPTMPAPMATLDGVTRRYGHIIAVDGLSLQIHSGETVALLGPNGAGKTTTVELLLGLTNLDAGVVRLFGGPPADAVAAGRVGAMLQDAGLPQGARVAELVGLVRSLYPQPHSVAEVLRLADLEGVARRRVEQLSGGQRQRVRLALAVAGNPQLLVLDEPTAALDVDARRTFWQRVRGYVAAGRTVLFATTGWRRPTPSPTAWSSSQAVACWPTAPRPGQGPGSRPQHRQRGRRRPVPGGP